MSQRAFFAAVGAAALLAGGGLWLAGKPARPGVPPDRIEAPAIAPAALYAASFADETGAQRSLGQFQGKLLILNFWATWCAPCREEMPGFARLQGRWQSRDVRFLGLSSDEPQQVVRFAREHAINYPLWTGGEVYELSRRLGNRLGVLPHTAIIGPQGKILDVKVGAYSEAELETKIRAFAAK